jgi:SAM-dependent methyltransferase
LEAEFGSSSDWVVEAAERLRLSERVAVACRGTGNPALLSAVADAAGISDGDVVLDVGSGLGGPAAWLEDQVRCTTVGFDLMEASVGAQRRLFSHSRSVVAGSDRLPFRSASFDAAWSLGVLEMVEDKPAALAEIARVLRPGGRLCLYEYTGEKRPSGDGPEANLFVPPGSMTTMIVECGLELVRAEPAPHIPDPPLEWRAVTRIVRSEIARSHAGDPRLEEAEQERQRFLGMRRSGEIEDWIFVAARPAR